MCVHKQVTPCPPRPLSRSPAPSLPRYPNWNYSLLCSLYEEEDTFANSMRGGSLCEEEDTNWSYSLLCSLSLTHSHLETRTDFIATTDPRPRGTLFDAGILEPGDARRDIRRQSRAREQAIERPREGAKRCVCVCAAGEAQAQAATPGISRNCPTTTTP